MPSPLHDEQQGHREQRHPEELGPKREGDRGHREGEDREHGGHLIETLLAYAEADLNAKAAAERLLIHVNTAHYRLGRIAERTGCDLRRLPDVIDLLIAVRLTAR